MRNKITAIIIALLSSSAQAALKKGGLFIEPMVTYEKGNARVDFPSPFGSSTSTVDGFGLGARLGVHIFESVFIGADGRYSMPTYKNHDTGIDAKTTAYNYGPVIGVQMPTTLGIRVWTGYIMGGDMDLDKSKGVDLKFKDSYGYRVGGGIKLAMVSLNLEFQKIRYEKTELQNGGLFSGTTDKIKQTNDAFILSVSFPISL